MHTLRSPAIDLTTDSLMAAVSDQFRSNSRFSLDPHFETPLELLIASLNKEAQLTPFGKHLAFNNLFRLLMNRFKADLYRKTYPELAKIEIHEPLFIVGLPRTGTTLLQNLLACDPENRVLRFWEMLFPVPLNTEDRTVESNRKRQTERITSFLHTLGPDLSTAHYLDPDGPEACFWLFVHTFADFIYEVNFHVPTYAGWLVEHENDARYYRDYLTFLQILSWQRPGKRWVLKSPRHLFALSALLRVFPKARFLHVHRNPMTSLASLCSLSRLSRSVYSADVDAHLIGRHFYDRYSNGLRQAVSARSRNDDRFYNVNYLDLVRAPIETIRNVYRFIGLELSDASSRAMEQWLRNNPRHKHGVHRYSLEEFALDGPESQALLKDYADYFPSVNFER